MVVTDIKKAIEITKGIERVSVSDDEEEGTPGIDKGLKDIAMGNVFHAKDSADLVNQIFG